MYMCQLKEVWNLQCRLHELQSQFQVLRTDLLHSLHHPEFIFMGSIFVIVSLFSAFKAILWLACNNCEGHFTSSYCKSNISCWSFLVCPRPWWKSNHCPIPWRWNGLPKPQADGRSRTDNVLCKYFPVHSTLKPDPPKNCRATVKKRKWKIGKQNQGVPMHINKMCIFISLANTCIFVALFLKYSSRCVWNIL